ncbi:L-lactate dehydrogenase A [Penicillium subrubescens]|uniref:L-lactate dehydrogenase A n=1 Tax=Penicillium subrubescens TaxID=1316194 RepID=A0A1Q5U6E6_9EURO|nr:L-lactate dehydrogenase A [Penicillium subrubescens]
MSSHGKPISRIAIIGVGQVGTAAAYAIILHSLASELLLVDIKTHLRNGQVNDLSDVSYSCNSQTSVRAATYQEARHSDIVVITAGSNYSRGETSTQHIYQKVSIIRSIINEMRPFRSDTILLIVANPVDLLTSLAHELSDLPASQVLGSGTFLDSVRIRNLLAEKTGVRAHICSSILSDKRNVRPISHFQPEWGCCVSLPVVLGRAGIIKKIQMPLNNEERAALDESVKDLRTKFERINEDQ